MSPRKPTQQPVVLTDPRAIRALAHPARLLVIERLYAGEIATSTELADAAGLSPSAMSYHLRALEKYGIVERAQNVGDARQHPWRALGTSLTIRSANPRGTKAAEGALLDTMLSVEQRAIATFIAHQGDEPAQWRDGLHINSSALQLTPDELASLTASLDAATAAYQARERVDPPADSRRVRLTILTIPVVD